MLQTIGTSCSLICMPSVLQHNQPAYKSRLILVCRQLIDRYILLAATPAAWPATAGTAMTVNERQRDPTVDSDNLQPPRVQELVTGVISYATLKVFFVTAEPHRLWHATSRCVTLIKLFYTFSLVSPVYQILKTPLLEDRWQIAALVQWRRQGGERGVRGPSPQSSRKKTLAYV